MKIHEKILQHIDPATIAQDVLDFVRVTSETGFEGDGSRFLAGLLQREGLEVELDEVAPGRPNVYARVPAARVHPDSGVGRALVLNGHTDTIPVGASAAPNRTGDWVVGRGAEDMKGGLVAMVHAVSALKRAGVKLLGDLWLTGVVDHETPVGKKAGPRRLIQHLRSGRVPADAILIAEGPAAIWAASLGSTIFHLRIEAGRDPVHTVKTRYAENPALWAGRALATFGRWEQEFAAAPGHPLCGSEQINVGMVHGGDYFNRLPTAMTITGTRRWTPGKTLADVQKEFQALCDELRAESGLAADTTFEAFREPFQTRPDHPLIGALREAGEAATGQTPELIGMALVGDANLYANEADVAAVYYGPAHETAHSDEERVSVTQLARCAGIYALAAARFCGVSSAA